MNLLIICSDVKNTSAQGVRYHYMVDKFLELGQVTMLTHSHPFVDENDKLNSVTVTKKAIPQLLAKILRMVLIPDTIIISILKYERAIDKLFQINEFDNVIIGMTPFSLLLLGKKIKSFSSQIKLIGDLSDPYSFNMGMKDKPIQRWLARLIEKHSFPYFDKLIVLNDTIKSKYQRKYPEQKEKFHTIEQGVDEGFIEAIQSHKIVENKEFTFIYAGGFYKRGRNPSNLYHAFENIGKTTRLKIYGNIRKNLRPPITYPFEYHKAVARDKLIDILAQADALILVDNKFGVQVPGKTIETLTSGKPVLFIYENEQSPTLQYVKDARGIVWAKNNTDEIRKGIEKIIIGDHVLPSFSYCQYTWSAMMNKYKTMITG